MNSSVVNSQEAAWSSATLEVTALVAANRRASTQLGASARQWKTQDPPLPKGRGVPCTDTVAEASCRLTNSPS